MIELSKLLYIIRYKGLQSIFSKIATLFLWLTDNNILHKTNQLTRSIVYNRLITG